MRAAYVKEFSEIYGYKFHRFLCAYVVCFFFFFFFFCSCCCLSSEQNETYVDYNNIRFSSSYMYDRYITDWSLEYMYQDLATHTNVRLRLSLWNNMLYMHTLGMLEV